MLRSSTARGVLAVIAAMVLLGVLRYKPWQRSDAGRSGGGATPAAGISASTEGGREKLTVGFLPVT